MNSEKKKERLDVLVARLNLAQSRERAQGYIMAGLVLVDGKRVDKCGVLVPVTAKITLIQDNIGYVSRGGLKLEKALDYFSIDLTGRVMADIGASTGGFTDCALKRGAAKVFAIDVGYGQLAWSLRTDERVVNLERTNIRSVTPEQLGEAVGFVSIDASFISLTKILPVARELLAAEGEMVVLIKPQFEAGREKVGKKGVVKDPLVHHEVIVKILDAAGSLGLVPAGLTFSPVKGPEGNIEYLLYLKNPVDTTEENTAPDVDAVVKEAHVYLSSRA